MLKPSPITPAQERRLYALIRKHGLEVGRVQRWLEKQTGSGRFADLDRDRYEALCARLPRFAGAGASSAFVPPIERVCVQCGLSKVVSGHTCQSCRDAYEMERLEHGGFYEPR